MPEKHKKILESFAVRQVFLEDSFEKIVIRSCIVPNGELLFFTKFHGEAEYKIHQSSKIVMEAINEGKEIDEAAYRNY